MQEFEVTTLKEYVAIIERLAKNGHTIWFRGHAQAKFKIKPKLYRKPQNSFNEYIELESKLIQQFKDMAASYSPPFNPESNWHWLFLMQHYGTPTRLLDWTTNPMMALYFALNDGTDEVENSVVWVLDTFECNTFALSNVQNEGKIVTIQEDILRSYSPNSQNPKSMAKYPVCIYGTQNNPRIISQRGVFTVFGSIVEDMEEILKSTKALTKLVIPFQCRLYLQTLLFNFGYSFGYAYPGLEGVSKDISTLNQF